MKLRFTEIFVVALLTELASGYWSDWSLWSPCSQTCENGLQYRTRRCIEGSCSSNATKEIRICNDHKPCDLVKSSRELQCEAFNGKKHYGKKRTWKPYFDSGNLCALTCKSLDNFVAVLKDKVEDGTPCSEGSTDVCIDGKCRTVGCDNLIDSTKAVDECGVCGGNGASCKHLRRYQWAPVLDGVCSASCGKGFVNIRFICEDTKIRAEADESHCTADVRPKDTKFVCNQKPCTTEYRWITEHWGNCSTACGHGVRHRKVFCSDSVDGNPVLEEKCLGPRPRSNELCILTNCSASYLVGNWSQCSATCGEGFRSREVVCKDSNGEPSRMCDPENAPPSVEICSAGFPCSTAAVIPLGEPLKLHEGGTESDFTDLEGKSRSKLTHDARFTVGDWSPCSVTCGEGVRTRTVSCRLYLSASKKFAEVMESECSGEKPLTTERCFMPPCSMSSILQPLSSQAVETNEIPEVDDFEYDYDESGEVGPPILLESLIELQPAITIYEWRSIGYSECSASCLGGVQKVNFACTKSPQNVTVDDYLCSERRPPDVYHVCNEGPCPPEWKTEEFGPCSVTCGKGVQTRQVRCVQNIADSLQIEVPEDKCPFPAPSSEQVCNEMDCPAEWRSGNWSKCFKSGGQCVRKREVNCAIASLSLHDPAILRWTKTSRSSCAGHAPKSVDVCPSRECKQKRPDEKMDVFIDGNPKDFVFYQRPSKKMVLLTIGGTAEVFKGTWLTIKCPTRGFSRSKIKWFKEDVRIKDMDRIEVTQSGNLLIYDVAKRDSGIYTCKAGRASEKINLIVKSKNGFSKKAAKKTLSENEESSHFNEIPKVLKSMSQTIDMPIHDQMRMIDTDKSIKDSLEESISRALSKQVPLPDIHFEWLVTPWSNCSQICGPQAFQVRGVSCLVRWQNATSEVAIDVKPSLCELGGLKDKPETRQQCGVAVCPQWKTGFWSRCEESKCLAHHTAVQVREVNCISENGEVMEEKYCKIEDKPLEKQKCKSRLCEGVWKSEEWSECQGRCGEKGLQTRLVLCVWKKNMSSLAGSACNKETQPIDRRDCMGELCPESMTLCADRSMFCKLVPLIKKCDKELYMKNCCLSCLKEDSYEYSYT